jgi:hypothetical protein
MIIAIAFILVVALLLWLLIANGYGWKLKLPLIVFVPLFMFFVGQGVKSYEGWPTSDSPPKQAYYVYGYAIEPDAPNHIKGAIYVWLVPPHKGTSVLKYNPHPGEARAYVLPYSQQLEATINAANKAAGAGQSVVLKKGKSSNASGRAGGANDPGTYKAYELPPVTLPPKTAGQ